MHIAGSIAAILIIGFFITSSLIAELYQDTDFVLLVKKRIFYSIPILLVVMPLVGITGNNLAGNSKNPLILEKKMRMKFNFNGVILITIASFLYYWAKNQEFGYTFSIIQIMELLLGFGNLVLLVKNFKVGKKLTAKR